MKKNPPPRFIKHIARPGDKIVPSKPEEEKKEVEKPKPATPVEVEKTQVEESLSDEASKEEEHDFWKT